MALFMQKADPANEKAALKHTEEAPHAPGGHDESNWLVSYADMMTLLCGFFILLFSMAKMDDPKYDSFKEAVAKQFGGDYASPTKDFAQKMAQAVQEIGVGKSASVKSDSLGVSIVFESAVFFDTLSADVSLEGQKILNKIIDKIAKQQTDAKKLYRVVIEGHTDSRPVLGGSYPSNWELSGARASRVVRMFLEKGFISDHLTAIGYSDTHPAVDARNASGKLDESALAKNRRVVLRILEPKVDAIPFPDDPHAAK